MNFGSYVPPDLVHMLFGFDIPTSSLIFIENVFYYSCFHCFLFLNGVNIFVDSRNTGVSYMKSYNYNWIKACSSFIFMN